MNVIASGKNEACVDIASEDTCFWVEGIKATQSERQSGNVSVIECSIIDNAHPYQYVLSD